MKPKEILRLIIFLLLPLSVVVAGITFIAYKKDTGAVALLLKEKGISTGTSLPHRADHERQDTLGAIIDKMTGRYILVYTMVFGILTVSTCAFALVATRRRYVEKKLSEREAELEEAQKIAHLGTFAWDVYSDRLRWSKETYRIFGVDHNEFGATYSDFFNLVHPEDRKSVKSAVERSLYGGRPCQAVFRILRPDGSTRFIHCRADIVRDVAGRIIRLIGTCLDVTERKESELELVAKTEELDRLNRDLHDLTIRMTRIEETERKRFAEILHDEIGQNLVAARLAFSYATKRYSLKSEDAEKAFAEISGLLEKTISQTRSMAAELYDCGGCEKVLTEAIEWYVRKIMEPSGKKVTLDIDPAINDLPGNAKKCLYRIHQESLQNVLKHSRATEVSLVCLVEEDILRFAVRDNGVGFDTAVAGGISGIGLRLMRERVKSLGGGFEVKSTPGAGTHVEIDIPLEEQTSSRSEAYQGKVVHG